VAVVPVRVRGTLYNIVYLKPKRVAQSTRTIISSETVNLSMGETNEIYPTRTRIVRVSRVLEI